MSVYNKKLHLFLDEKVSTYSAPAFFLDTDPIQVPKQFTKKQDVEISAFLSATIAWGQRKSIIANALKLMQLMEMEPHRFLLEAGESEYKKFEGFVHRTFNATDCLTFLSALKAIYQAKPDLESFFCTDTRLDLGAQLHDFKKRFFAIEHLPRSQKHLADPLKGSSAKRLCMFLRWMVRPPATGSDFGIWQSLSPACLYLPLDVHSGRIARKLGLLERKQDDWRAVSELTTNMRLFDPLDPCKYDYALFGLGAFEKY